jgi:hypothetical protein
MSFPYMNTESVTKSLIGSAMSTIIAYDTLPSGQYNIMSVPGVVDVSAMEFSIGIRYDAAGTKTFGAVTGASTILIGAADGGASGDATSVAALFADISNTVTAIFAANVPVDVAGTSATDLDVDDWVNGHVGTSITGTTGAGAVDVAIGYLYGKPGGIN